MRNSTGECGERFNLWSKKVLIQNIKAVYFKKILIITCKTQLYTIAGFYKALEANQNIFKAHKMNIKGII